MLNIRFATLEDIPEIRGMADSVFRRTYKNILSPEQMEYMMDWMYSESSLKNQIDSLGKRFLLADSNGRHCGYASYEYECDLEDGRKQFHLQKLYVLPEYQGRGVGVALFDAVKSNLAGLCPGGFRIELNVNRNNSAVGFYEHIGMRRARQGDFPIGEGFFMNDYIYAQDFF